MRNKCLLDEVFRNVFKLTADFSSPNTNVDEALDASSSRIDVPELEGSPATQQLGQTQSCEHFSDEDDSTIGSAHEPPPAYEHAPQEIDINQEGFHASATTACKFACFEPFTKDVNQD